MGELPNSRTEDVVSSAEREEDAALARRAGSGEAEAFGVLYDRYVDAVYRYVFYRVRNEAEAEDVTSDVFMRALRAIPKYEPRQAFLAWLYRIARNAVIDRSRRQAARQQVSFEDALAHPNADQVAFALSFRNDLLRSTSRQSSDRRKELPLVGVRVEV